MKQQKNYTQRTSNQSDATRSQSTDKWNNQATETKSAINLLRRGHQVRSITEEK